MTTETPAQRLGRLVRARRRQLKMTQADVQEADGPSTATLRLIEGGHHTEFRDGTGTALEKALGWQFGSIESLLDGGDPTPLATATTTQKPARPGGQTASHYGYSPANIIAAVDNMASALELIVVTETDDDHFRAGLSAIQEKLEPTVMLLVVACEIIGEALAAEDISDDLATFASRLDKHADNLAQVQSIAWRLSRALTEQSADDAERARVLERLKGRFSPNTVPVDNPDNRREER